MPFPFPPPQGTIPHGLVPDNLRSGVTIDGITGSVNVRDTAVPSTNLVLNSGFEVVTTTATLFSDPLTGYSGSSAAPWTVRAGSFTFSSSGATSDAGSSYMTAGNSAWKPLLGTDGSTSLPLTAQVSFTQPSAVTGMTTYLVVDSNNQYYASDYGGTFYLFKVANGTAAQLASVAQTIAAASTYTLTLALDYQGNLTAKLYSGSGTGGTLLQTLTATDTSLTGGFLLGVGGGTGVVVTDASMTGPWADAMERMSNDPGNAYALDTGYAGQYSALLQKGIATDYDFIRQTFNGITAGDSYTFSCRVKSTGSIMRVVFRDNGSGYASQDFTLTPNQWTYVSSTHVASTGATTIDMTAGLESGQGITGDTVWFDDWQLEQGASATPYVENDLTFVPTTPTAADLLTGTAAFANGAVLAGTMPNQGSPTFTPSGSAQSIPAGYYGGGTVKPIQITTGSATSGSSEVTFDLVSGSTQSAYPLTITPPSGASTILAVLQNLNYTGGQPVASELGYADATNASCYCFSYATTGGPIAFTTGSHALKVSSSAIVLPVGGSNISYDYVIYWV